jgi:hypothetical protein
LSAESKCEKDVRSSARATSCAAQGKTWTHPKRLPTCLCELMALSWFRNGLSECVRLSEAIQACGARESFDSNRDFEER